MYLKHHSTLKKSAHIQVHAWRFNHFVLMACLLLVCPLSYGEVEAGENDNENDEIIIFGVTPFSQQVGTQQIMADDIENTPTGNGNITDLLKNNANVQFSNEADNSNTGGEIKPNEVSFHGEKFYNNQFVVDGMSNNDNFNPNAGSISAREPIGTAAHHLPAGGTQSFWLDASLVDNVEVFDSNVSAKYGQFTGGVVNANLKKPSFEKRNSGKIYYRTTRDGWANFHVQDDEAFEQATELNLQPEFTKQQYGLVANHRVNDDFALTFSYNKTQSDILYNHPNLYFKNADGTLQDTRFYDNQTRTNETFLLRGLYFPNEQDTVSTTLMYSPHVSKTFKRNVVNGAFTNTGGGVQANVKWERLFDNLEMVSYIGYKQTGNEIKHQDSIYRRYIASDNLNWVSSSAGFAQYGGFGQYATEKATVTAKQDYTLARFSRHNIEHKWLWGWAVDVSSAKYQRDVDSYNYTYNSNSNVVCNGAQECINGDQFATQRMIFKARNVSARDDNYSAYLQDDLTWRGIEGSVGLRVDYNAFLGNVDIAPRISGTYDVFGNQKTRILMGLNRYYAGSMLSYKLKQGIGENTRNARELNSDGTVGDWQADRDANNTYRYASANIKTPYSDEAVLGLSQTGLGMDWVSKWVHREGKDQFVQSSAVIDGVTHRVLGNGGWSKNDTFTLSISPQSPTVFKYAQLKWNAGARYSKGTTNNQSYDADTTDDEVTKAIYNNQLIDLEDLPPADFNSPWSAFLSLDTRFSSINLNWGQRLNYTHGHVFREASTDVACNGASTFATYRDACGDFVGDAVLYKDVKTDGLFSLDWRFAYTQNVLNDDSIHLTLDINNVLDEKAIATSSGSTTTYKMGRNMWLGLAYNW